MPLPEQNAYARVQTIISDSSTANPPIYSQIQDARDRFGIPFLGRDQAKVLRPGIEHAKARLDLARGLLAFPRGRSDSIIPKEGELYTATLPIIPFLDLVKGLCADARLRLFDGDNSGAIQDCLTVLHIGGTLADTPELLAQLVRDAIDVRACDLVEKLLATGRCPANQLSSLQEILEVELAAPRGLLGIRAERAHFDWVLEQVQSGTISSQKLEETFMSPGRGLIARGIQYFRYSLLISNLPEQRAKRLRAINELISVSQLPYQRRFLAMRELDEKLGRQSAEMFNWLDTASAPGRIYAHHLKEDLLVDAVLSCTIVAIAVERFRQRYKRWPESLDELSPRFLKTLLLDPFTGEPLHLVRKGAALVIYSVGQNLTDDGGALANRFAASGMDIGFVLLDPDQVRRAEIALAYFERAREALKSRVQNLQTLLPNQ